MKKLKVFTPEMTEEEQLSVILDNMRITRKNLNLFNEHLDSVIKSVKELTDDFNELKKEITETSKRI